MAICYKECKVCGSTNVAKIIYGLPSFEVVNDVDAVTIVLDGCIFSEDSPWFHCSECETE